MPKKKGPQNLLLVADKLLELDSRVLFTPLCNALHDVREAMANERRIAKLSSDAKRKKAKLRQARLRTARAVTRLTKVIARVDGKGIDTIKAAVNNLQQTVASGDFVIE